MLWAKVLSCTRSKGVSLPLDVGQVRAIEAYEALPMLLAFPGAISSRPDPRWNSTEAVGEMRRIPVQRAGVDEITRPSVKRGFMVAVRANRQHRPSEHRGLEVP
jgi:hypothetical protein